MARTISTQEISGHNILEDLWIVVNGKVYNITDFAPEHPGGAGIILRYAGRDASKAYNEVHAPSLVESSLSSSQILGELDISTINDEWLQPAPEISTSFKPELKPPLETLISTHDFEFAASKTLTPKTWAFYSSAATDLITKRRNNSVYGEIGLRPRILRNVRDVDTTTRMLGQKVTMPIFCAPSAMAKLAHKEGEKEIGRACKSKGIPQCISTMASFPITEIVEAVADDDNNGLGDMTMFFQLYVDKQRQKSEKLLAEVERLGIKAVFVTVDAPVAGKREADERVKTDETISAPMSGQKAKNDSKGGAMGRIMSGYIDATLNWDDLPWLRRSTKLPIVLKGVQTAMDAKKAMDLGIEGIVISNHGGRSLDTSPLPILVLLELQKCVPEVFDRMEVFVDGGIMRGTDIFKALCLGARSVGIGRGFLFALNYGQEGVEKYIDILRDELETTMRMCGITDLSQVHPGLLNTRAVDHLVADSEEHPYAKWRPKARI